MIFVGADSLVGVGVSQARIDLDDHVRPVRTTGHPGTLLALLRHLALDHSTATIGRKWSEVVSGTILSVSEEVIAGRGESEDWFVPVAAVSWVRPTEGLKSML